MRRAGLGLLVGVVAIAAMPATAGSAPPASGPDAIAEAAKPKRDKGKGNKGKRKHRKRNGPAALRLFDSCEAVIEYGDLNARRVIGPNYQPANLVPFPPESQFPNVRPVSGGKRKSKKKGDAGSPEKAFSQTNTQEVEVDEPDIVKTNGDTIFAIGGGSLHAINANLPVPQVLQTRPLPGFGHELLLLGDKLLVFSQKRELPEAVETPAMPAPAPPLDPNSDSEPPHPEARTVTLMTELDVSAPAAMQEVATQEVDGRYVSARMTGQQVRVVISSRPAATIAPESELRSPLGGWVPYSKTVEGATVEREPAVDNCGEIGRPGKFSGLNMLSVLTIDMAQGLPSVDSEGVVSDGEIVYASTDSLYVATERWLGARRPKDPSHAATTIHKFDISQPGVTTYKASGYVRGRLLNQFAMDEHEGVLRAATTGGLHKEAGAQLDESFVSALAEDGDKLALLGRAENLGEGERIYAVRMEGEIGYVVTFRQVDPLYTLDLSNPQNPKVVGELKIPGYSAYLHPISEDRIIGVGAAATNEGDRIGTQVSLFDVGNPRKPKRLSHQTIRGSRTSVEDTHHAFLYWAPTRKAVIPVTSMGNRRGRGFVGALGFRIGTQNIAPAGRVAHTGARFRDEILRTLVIDDRLFSVSCTGVEVADLLKLKEQGWAAFPDREVCLPPPVFTD